MTIEQLLFDVSDALRVPVLVAALACLVVVFAEAGALLAELWRRRGRGVRRLERDLDSLRSALAAGERGRALVQLDRIAYSRPMREALIAIVDLAASPGADDRVAKHLAEYDYRSLRRLERTRILVRLGPALGLMGTLIPLSPALAGLAAGDVERLTQDLRVAFSVTVAGLLVGAVAFAISLVRDRLYAQDFSDVEFAAAELGREQPAPALVPDAVGGPA
jgi:biopolymer transport protein ExbB/TolQ